jgi:hypothetical protein
VTSRHDDERLLALVLLKVSVQEVTHRRRLIQVVMAVM